MNLEDLLQKVRDSDLELESRSLRCLEILEEVTRAERGFLVILNQLDWEGLYPLHLSLEEIDAPGYESKRFLVHEAAKKQRTIRTPATLAVPILHEGRAFGAILLDSLRADEHRDLVESFAERVGPLLALSKLHSAEHGPGRLEQMRRNIVAGLADRYSAQQQELHRIRRHLDAAVRGQRERYELATLLGGTERMREVRRVLEKASETDLPILVEGETGTGKELIARAIHAHSPRAAGPMVTVDCGAVVPSLIESEIFGHVRGAFTGAASDRPGLAHTAEGGTLFFDEIGDLPQDLQPKILRLIQFRELRKVGADQAERVDVRVIAATNRDLRAMIREGRFREDLYFRLNAMAVTLSPLRERREDIPDLARLFVRRIAEETGRAALRLSNEALDSLVARSFPGNIRELENFILRAATMCEGDLIRPGDLAEASSPDRGMETAPSTGPEYQRRKAEAVRNAADRVTIAFLENVLSRAGGNVSRAAVRAGVNRSWLQTLASRHRVDPRRYRSGGGNG